MVKTKMFEPKVTKRYFCCFLVPYADKDEVELKMNRWIKKKNPTIVNVDTEDFDYNDFYVPGGRITIHYN